MPTYTYSAGLTDEVSQVRFLISDTDVSDSGANAEFSDEDISGAVSFAGGVYQGAAMLADTLATRYQTEGGSISVDGLSVDYSSQVDHYTALANRLRATSANGGIGEPSVTGTSIGEMESVGADTDRPTSAFSVVPPRYTPPEIG